MTLSDQTCNGSDLQWWVTNLPLSAGPLHRQAPDYTVETDASTLGRGANFNGRTTGGQCSQAEAMYHINLFELQACLLTFPLCSGKDIVFVLIFSCFAAKRSETGFVFVKVFFFFSFFQRFPYRKCIAITHVSFQALFFAVFRKCDCNET